MPTPAPTPAEPSAAAPSTSLPLPLSRFSMTGPSSRASSISICSLPGDAGAGAPTAGVVVSRFCALSVSGTLVADGSRSAPVPVLGMTVWHVERESTRARSAVGGSSEAGVSGTGTAACNEGSQRRALPKRHPQQVSCTS